MEGIYYSRSNGTEGFSWLLEKGRWDLKGKFETGGRANRNCANKFLHPIEELFIKKDTGIFFLANGYFGSRPAANTTLANTPLLSLAKTSSLL